MVSSHRDDLASRAAQILRENDRGGWTKAAPELYPHQWSWDAAFVAIGWAHVDTSRAFTELESLFSAQWASGMVPHIVFDPEAAEASYFPGPSRWDCRISVAAPDSGPRTSGICQPPVHAIALGQIWAKASDEPAAEPARRRLAALFPQVLRWHRYLMTRRDPERSGLVTIYHPWESGSDNSPRWDTALAAVRVGNDLPPFRRRDTRHVGSAERPTDEEYARYLWLVEVLKRCEYDDEAIYGAHPFLVKDVFFSALLVVANEVLLELANELGVSQAECDEIAEWIERGRAGLRRQFDPELGLGLDRDVLSGLDIPVRTFAGLAPLIAGGLEPDLQAAQLARLTSEDFLGNPKLRWPLIPTTSPAEPTFNSRKYWRGPVWPVITWVVWWSLVRAGERDHAEELREAALAQISASGFAEYLDPFSGEALGSDSQSWTAAVVLDWLSHQRRLSP